MVRFDFKKKNEFVSLAPVRPVLTAAKWLKEKNIAFDCFEKGSDIGGNWRYENDNGMSSAYRSLHIISSKWNMQYSDFPMPDDFPDYGHHSDVLKYFEAYVDHFGLREHISFNTEVRDVSPAAGGMWDVTLGNGKTRRYDAVLVANGHHWNPRLPSFPGSFNGQELHSHHYKSAETFAGKNVLIVGIGNSGCDISIDLCRQAASVTLSTRRSAYVLPKYFLGIPADQWTNSLGEKLPVPVRRFFFNTMIALTVGNQERYGLPKPKHKLLEEHPTLNQEFLSYVGHGRVKVKPNIKLLDGDFVEFEDETREPFDVIIYATGYRISFPFLRPEILDIRNNRVELYRNVVHPNLNNLYFIGLLQPLGAIMPLAEIQSKWVAGLISGELALPDKSYMLKAIEKDLKAIRRRYTDSTRHTIQVDFWNYMNLIKREIRRSKRWARKKVAASEEAVPV